MMEDIKSYMDKLIELKITPNQFLFCYLIHTDNYAEIYRYTEKGAGWKKEELENLVNRGFIMNINQDGEWFSDGFIVTEKFTKGFLFDAYEKAKEFYEAYPAFGSIDGKPFPTKKIAPDKFYSLYNKVTGEKIEVHERAMKALDYAKKTGLANMRIDNWVESRMWEHIEKSLKHAAQKPGDREFVAD